MGPFFFQLFFMCVLMLNTRRVLIGGGCSEYRYKYHTRMDRSIRPLDIVEIDALSPGTKKLAIEHLFGSVDEIVLGYDYERGHMYLNVGRVRVDPGIIFPGDLSLNAKVSRGLLLRFKHIPEETRKKIHAHMIKKGEKMTFSCASGVCDLLEESAGITVNLNAYGKLYPNRVFKSIIEEGLTDHVGDPIAVEVWQTDSRPLRQVLADGLRSDKETAMGTVFMVSYIGFSIGISIYGVVIFNDEITALVK